MDLQYTALQIRTNILKSFDVIHNSVVRIVIEAFRTIPISRILLCEAGEITLEHRKKATSLFTFLHC